MRIAFPGCDFQTGSSVCACLQSPVNYSPDKRTTTKKDEYLLILSYSYSYFLILFGWKMKINKEINNILTIYTKKYDFSISIEDMPNFLVFFLQLSAQSTYCTV